MRDVAQALGLALDSLADLVEVCESVTQAAEVTTAVVLEVVLLEELADELVEFNEFVLGHGGEEVVLDLVVEVPHPPVGEEVWGDVHSVVGSVLSPVHMLVSVENVEVCVGECEVDEDV